MVTYNQYRQMNEGQAVQDVSQSLQALLMYLAQREDRKYERERDAKRDEMMMRQFRQSQEQDTFNQLMATQRQDEAVTTRTQSVGIATQDKLQGEIDTITAEFSQNVQDAIQHSGVRLVPTNRPADAAGTPAYDPIALGVDYNGLIANEDQFDPEAVGVAVAQAAMTAHDRMLSIVDRLVNPTNVRNDLLASGMSEAEIDRLASSLEDQVRVTIEDAFNNELAGNNRSARQAQDMAAGVVLAMASSNSAQAPNARALLRFAPNAITPIIGSLEKPEEANDRAIQLAISGSYRTSTTADDDIQVLRPPRENTEELLERTSEKEAELLGTVVNRMTIGSAEYGDLVKQGYEVGVAWYDANGKLQESTLSQEKAVLAAQNKDPAQQFNASFTGKLDNFYLAWNGRAAKAFSDKSNRGFHLYVTDRREGDGNGTTISVGLPYGFVENVQKRFANGQKHVNFDTVQGGSRDQISRAMAKQYTGSPTADNSWLRDMIKNGVLITPNNVMPEAGYRERWDQSNDLQMSLEDTAALQEPQPSKEDVLRVTERMYERKRAHQAGVRQKTAEERRALARLVSFINPHNGAAARPYQNTNPDAYPEGSELGIWDVGVHQALHNLVNNKAATSDVIKQRQAALPPPQQPQQQEQQEQQPQEPQQSQQLTMSPEQMPPLQQMPASPQQQLQAQQQLQQLVPQALPASANGVVRPGGRNVRPARSVPPATPDSGGRIVQRLGPLATEDPEDVAFWGHGLPVNGPELFPPGSEGDLNMQRNELLAMAQLRQQDEFENAQARQREIDETVGRRIREAMAPSGMSYMSDPYSELSMAGFPAALAAANEQYATPFGAQPTDPAGMLPERFRDATFAYQPQPFGPLADEELFRQEFTQAGNPNGFFGTRLVPTGITSSPNDINTAPGGTEPFGPPIPGQVGYEEYMDAVGDAQALFAMSPPDVTADQDAYNMFKVIQELEAQKADARVYNKSRTQVYPTRGNY
jgi:hypothetical protein